MKRQLLALAILGFSIFPFATACSFHSQTLPAKSGVDGYQALTSKAAKQILDENPGAVLVDVRTQEEYEESHIEGALLIPNETIQNERPEQLPDLDAQILLYCRSGVRAGQAAGKLVQMGYTNVSNMGGIIDWPYETVSGHSGH